MHNGYSKRLEVKKFEKINSQLNNLTTTFKEKAKKLEEEFTKESLEEK